MGIKRHTEYGKYVLIHKWYVMIECFKIGLIWRGLKHDLDKFLPWQWIPYARHFHEPDGTKKTVRDSTGFYKPYDTGDLAFDKAIKRHCIRNSHHWQFHTFPKDVEGVRLFKYPVKDILEMICDWKGAAHAQGVKNWWNPTPWWSKNRTKLQMHPDTVEQVRAYLTMIRVELKYWYKFGECYDEKA